MTGLSEMSNRRLDSIVRSVDDLLSRNPVPSTPATPKANQIRLFVDQVAHGFTRGKAVTLYDSAWILYDSTIGRGNVTVAAPQLWGIVDRAHADCFSVIVFGEAVVPGFTFQPGWYYKFQSGVPVEMPYGATDGWQRTTAAGFGIVTALSTSSVVVAGTSVRLPLSSQATFTLVTVPNAMTYGDIVARNATSGAVAAAIADPAQPDINLPHCVLVQLISTGVSTSVWLALTGGEAYATADGNIPGGPGSYDYLSSTVAGKRVLVAPAMKVYVGTFISSFDALSGTSSLMFVFPGSGYMAPVAYPLDAAHGGVGADLSTIADNSVLTVKTVSGAKQIWGNLNVGATGFLTQAGGADPTWTGLDIGAGHSLEINSGILYARIAGARSSATIAPAAGTDYLKYNQTTGVWEPFGLWAGSATTGWLSCYDAAVDEAHGHVSSVFAGLKQSVFGRATGSDGLPACIQATADGQVLQRLAGVVQFAAFSGLPAVTSADEGKSLWVTSGGTWSATRDIVLGKGALTATSTQGSLGVVSSSDGDYIKLSSGGVEIYDRSINASTPLIRINIGHASLTSAARALAVGEAYVCDPSSGTVKTMMLIRSDPY